MSISGDNAVPLPLPAGLSATQNKCLPDGRVSFLGAEDRSYSGYQWTADSDGGNAAPVPNSKRDVYPWNAILSEQYSQHGMLSLMTDAGFQTWLFSEEDETPHRAWTVFAGQKNSAASYDWGKESLWIVQSGSVPKLLEKQPLQARAPVWSPDGKTIAFQSRRGSLDGHYAVFVIGRDGKGLKQLTDYAINATRPLFSPDGRHLLIEIPAPQAMNIAMIDVP
jgi:dipeptidyl aminopeptidase/acylaminoacyl peptidase